MRRTRSLRWTRFLIKIGLIGGLFYWGSLRLLDADHVSAVYYMDANAYGGTIQVQDSLGKAVPGVSFCLYKSENSMIPLHYIKTDKWKAGESISTYSKTTTGYNGTLHFYGLEEGNYYLEEIKVPYGYQSAKKRMEIYLDKDTAESGIDYYIVLKKLK